MVEKWSSSLRSIIAEVSPTVWQIGFHHWFLAKIRKNRSPTVCYLPCHLLPTWQMQPFNAQICALATVAQIACCSCCTLLLLPITHELLDLHNHCLLLLYAAAPGLIGRTSRRLCWCMSHPCLLLLIHYTLVYLFKKYIWLNTLEAWLLARGKWINNNLKLR